MVLAKSTETLSEFDLHVARDEVDELVLIVNPGARFGGLGTIANRVIARTPCDVFGIVHADTSFGPGALRTFAEAALGKVVGLVGRTLDGTYVWSKDIESETCVSTLDGCSVFFERSSGLTFDAETFDSFHCAVEDLCLSAAAQGMGVAVPPAQATHNSKGTFASEWQLAYLKYRKKLAEKWAGVCFSTT